METRKKNQTQKCKRCKRGILVTDFETGEIFCKRCGYVIIEQINEVNSIPRDVEESKTGSPTSLAKHDMGLSTVIGSTKTDATGKPFSTSMKNHVKKLKLHDSRSLGNSSDRSLKIAFNFLWRLKDKLTLPNIVVDDTAYIYRKVVEKNLVRGRSVTGMMSAATYAACRKNGVPRNLKDFAQVGNLKRKDVARCYRILLRELDLQMPVADSIQCVPRIASRIGTLEKTKQYAIKILKMVYENGMAAGKDPMGLAAAALYYACLENGENVTQRVISKSSNVTEVTIRNQYHGLKKMHIKKHSKEKSK